MRKITAGSRTIHCVDHHHQVLAAWAEYRRANPGKPAPHLVTLDHHTDTQLAFLRAYPGARMGMTLDNSEMEIWVAPHLTRLGTCQPSDVEQAIHMLAHDEHIDAAEKAGIIAGTFILLTGDGIARSDKQRIHRPRRIIIEGEKYNTCDEVASAALTLEPETVNPLISMIEDTIGKPLEDVDYILDIDLDTFQSERAARPDDEAAWHRLIRGAALITVAMESGCVEEGRIDNETITAASLLDIIRHHVGRA